MRLRSFVYLMVFALGLSQVPLIHAQEGSSLKVTGAAICRNVVALEPVDIRKKFEPTVGKLYCFTTIAGAERGAQITHVWFYGDVERARVNLPVRSIKWRTYSSKRIQAHETGTWRVDILGPDGNVLKTLEFEIGP